jgi:uncharacterized surface protein with fasciclin (FAS1) repeats
MTLLLSLLLIVSAGAFTAPKSLQQRVIDDSSWSNNKRRSYTSSSTTDANAALSSAARDQAEVYLTETYPKFCTLLRQNPMALERMRSSTSGYAVFAPNDSAFDALGPERLYLLDMALSEMDNNKYNNNNNNDDGGLVDVLSTMAEYHMCSVPATADIMKTYGVVTTSMGELPVTVTEDGTTMYVNGVRVIRSYQFEERLVRDYRDVNGNCLGTEEVIESSEAGFEMRRCIIHETEGLVCPDELWNIMYARAQMRPSSSAAGLSAI